MKCVPGEVHLWRIELDGDARACAALRSALSAEERERAERFRFAELRERWMVAHGALRSILAAYEGCDPGELEFEKGLQGKPALTHTMSALSFNLAHTDHLAMVAVTAGARIGVDAEAVRAGIEAEELSRHYFAPAEVAEILAMPEDERVAAFYRCWSRKEALVKAVGGGLSLALDRFQVNVRGNEPAQLVRAKGELSGCWSLLDVSETGVAAAIAVEGQSPVLRRMDFVPPTMASTRRQLSL